MAPLSPGLYAIVDLASLASLDLDAVEFAKAVLSARPSALQIRAKGGHARELLGLLRALAPVCRAASVPLVANDRVDLAILSGCGFVHVGQEDMTVEQVRRVSPDLGVGVSTHTEAQLSLALASRPDYVAYGPVFETRSKEAPDPCVGTSGLALASRRAVLAGVPLVAIGGITLDRCSEVRPYAVAAAVIQGLLPVSSRGQEAYEEVRDRAHALQAALGGAREATAPSA